MFLFNNNKQKCVNRIKLILDSVILIKTIKKWTPYPVSFVLFQLIFIINYFFIVNNNNESIFTFFTRKKRIK